MRCNQKTVEEQIQQGRKQVIVLLATFNGDQFIRRQLESILTQTITNWKLLIRDDGSTDRTPEIIRDFADRDNRITIVSDVQGATGAASANFSVLCDKANELDADYCFFCDQDDYWLPHKLESLLTQLLSVESENGKNPLLVYSDLAVVDQHDVCISESFMRHEGLQDQPYNPLQKLLPRNYVTGCAMAVNKPLLKLACPIPNAAIVHDWWFALCAAAAGSIIFVDEPLVEYRQHEANVIGTKGYSLSIYLRKLLRWQIWVQGRENLFDTLRQAEALQKRVAFRVHDTQGLGLISHYANLLRQSRVARFEQAVADGFSRQGALRQMVFYTLLLILGKEK